MSIDQADAVSTEVTQAFPSTEAQREIWTSDRLGPDASCAFNESITLRIQGSLDEALFERAVVQTVNRHGALRSRFSPDGQTIEELKSPVLGWKSDDLSDLGESARSQRLEQIRVEEVETPLELDTGPLLRVRLVRLSETQHAVILTAHHIVCDGWSMALLLRDLATTYTALARGESPALAPASSFSDYSRAMQEFARSPAGAEEQAFWLSQFSGEVPVLELPIDRPRPPIKTFVADRVDYRLERTLVAGLRRRGSKAGASLFVTLLAAFQVFLHRITGQDDIVVGVPSAGQLSLDLPEVIGHCVNTLPIRSKISSSQSMQDLLRSVRGTALDALEHPRYTFGTLIRNLKVPRDPSRIPLVSVLFNLDQPPPPECLAFADLQVEYQSNPRRYETFEIFLNAVDHPEGMVLECQYNVDLFDRKAIETLLESFEAMLQSMVAEPDTTVGKLPLLSLAQQQRILVDWNDTKVEFGVGPSIPALLAEPVNRSKDRIAVEMDGETLTYDEIDRRSSQLAQYLRQQGVTSGQLVGIYHERSPAMVIGLLAILKSGAGYVPLDPAFPEERLRYMADDAQLVGMLTEESLVGSAPSSSGFVVCLDRDEASWAACAPVAPEVEIAASDIAYVIYTSGSTGKPKGVEVPHGAVVNFLCSMRQTPGIAPEDVLVAVTTLSFDIAVLELLLPLCLGAKVVLASRDTASDGDELLELLRTVNATILQATPSTWRLLLEAGWDDTPRLKALCGGEAMPADLVPRLLERTSSLWNMYGPTETTVWSTCHQITGAAAPISIGRPIANTQVYLLDANFEPVPPGVPGELYIGGAGVTLGYRHRSELTAERFVDNPYYDPFADYVSGKLYRTGDIVRWRHGGDLEYFRRNDHQVKLRGYRIELGEIETVLAKQPGIQESAVTVWQGEGGDTRLVAYYVPARGETLTATELRKGLRQYLPDYMVPQHFVELEALPRTNNNKIDRKSLPAPVGAPQPSARAVVAPRTEKEVLVAEVWKKLLGTDQLSVDDNFFQLGGHSLTAMQAIVEIAQRTGKRLAPRAMLLATLEQIASELPDLKVTPLQPAKTSSEQSKPIGLFHRLIGT